MIFNLKKQITYTPATPPGTPPAEPRSVHAGRMECTMQNLADALTQRFPAPLSDAAAADLATFVVFNERRYVTSSAKRTRTPGSSAVAQTPEGAHGLLGAVTMHVRTANVAARIPTPCALPSPCMCGDGVRLQARSWTLCATRQMCSRCAGWRHPRW
jgi:hypothetical protein